MSQFLGVMWSKVCIVSGNRTHTESGEEAIKNLVTAQQIQPCIKPVIATFEDHRKLVSVAIISAAQ